MNGNKIVTIGITMGDPSGIGPEIILKSFEKEFIRSSRLLVIGDFKIMELAHSMLKISSFSLKKVNNISECDFQNDTFNILDINTIDLNVFSPGKVQASSGDAAYQSVVKAIDLANHCELDAVVTAPLNKEAMNLSGHFFPGHTEVFANFTNTANYAMLLYDPRLSVIHVSTHISLLESIKGLRKNRIEEVIELAHFIMKKICGRDPRIAVAGINPHAGENGMFGDEEIKQIAPAVKNMKEKGYLVEGPYPPDTVFLQAFKGKFDIVVAMYHDQGHIPLKLIGFDSGVNITVGLPFVRTSVDHGTAFEIAWQGIANEGSMVEAIRIALQLSS
jgi:4-hydroxythreonine-4-phosphate dehydrogenase